MDREALKRIAEEAVRDEELSVGEIPAIDLYVDQIINLVGEKLKSGSERYAGRQLTKTMINNYSKDGLITPVKGKKYNREQILQILTIYSLKNSLSMGEIKRMLHGAYASEGFDGESLLQVYDRYIALKRENRGYTLEILEELMNRYELTAEDEGEQMLLIGTLLSLSVFLRNAAQAILEESYPPLPDPDEKKEEEKKEKEEKKEREKEEKREEKKEEKKEKEKAKKEKESQKEREKREKEEKKEKKKSSEPESEENK